MCTRSLILIILIFPFLSSSDVKAQQVKQNKFPYASDKPILDPILFIQNAFGTAITPDGNTIYFANNNAASRKPCIMKINYQNGKWTKPDTAEFSGQYSDGDPFISPDGSKIFFWSNRPIDKNSPNSNNNANIWMAEKTANGFCNPVFLGKQLGISNGGAPTVSFNNTIYFFSKDFSKPDRGLDIYKSEIKNGEYSNGINLSIPVNSIYDDFDAFISPNEDYILISSSRPGNYGKSDIYISFCTNGNWGNPMNLGCKINSSGYEFCPIVSPDGNYLFFTSDKSGSGSIYQVEFKSLLDSLRTNINVNAILGKDNSIDLKAPICFKDKIEKIKFSKTPLWLKPYIKTVNSEKQIFNKIYIAKLENGIHKAKVNLDLGDKTPNNYQYQVTLNLIKAIPAAGMKNLKKGLRYDYYEDTILTRIPDFTSIKPKKTGIVKSIDLSVKERDTLFAMVLKGFLNIDKTDMYTFCLNSDDGSRLYVDDSLIIDNDGLHAPTEKYGNACLAKGLHKIRLEYIQGKQGSLLEIYFIDPDTGAKIKVIRNEQLFYN